MPNHITNRLTIIGNEEDVEKVLDFIKIEKGSEADDGDNGIGTIDFNKITPMPENVYRGDLSSHEEHPLNWYDWSIENWGTKWNAYHHRIEDDNTLYFETAWSGVPNLIQKLSGLFPNVTIDYSFCDEDFGYNVASLRFNSGNVTDLIEPVGGSKEAYELALDIVGYTADEMGLIYNKTEQNYVWNYEE